MQALTDTWTMTKRSLRHTTRSDRHHHRRHDADRPVAAVRLRVRRRTQAPDRRDHVRRPLTNGTPGPDISAASLALGVHRRDAPLHAAK
jgi:hypothetical protein